MEGSSGLGKVGIFQRKERNNKPVIKKLKKKAFPCDICPKVLSNPKALESHKASFHTPILCQFCCEDHHCSRNRDDFRKHLRQKHFDQNLEALGFFVCPKCSRVLGEKSHLDTHLRKFHEQGQCQKCKMWVLGRNGMSKHQKVCCGGMGNISKKDSSGLEYRKLAKEPKKRARGRPAAKQIQETKTWLIPWKDSVELAQTQEIDPLFLANSKIDPTGQTEDHDDLVLAFDPFESSADFVHTLFQEDDDPILVEFVDEMKNETKSFFLPQVRCNYSAISPSLVVKTVPVVEDVPEVEKEITIDLTEPRDIDALEMCQYCGERFFLSIDMELHMCNDHFGKISAEKVAVLPLNSRVQSWEGLE